LGKVTSSALKRDVSPNPYDDVPEGLAEALEEYILTPNHDDLYGNPGRMGAVNLLFDQLTEIFDDRRLRPKWEAVHKDRGFKVAPDENGAFREAALIGHEKTEVAEVPDHIINALISEVLGKPRQERYAALMATNHLVNEWIDLVIDGEKLLGHLLRVHASSTEVATLPDSDLWSIHSRLHADARRASTGDWEAMKLAHSHGLRL
jgi:hypothetical protein